MKTKPEKGCDIGVQELSDAELILKLTVIPFVHKEMTSYQNETESSSTAECKQEAVRRGYVQPESGDDEWQFVRLPKLEGWLLLRLYTATAGDDDNELTRSFRKLAEDAVAA
jgi:hypothetical protein